MDRVAVFVDAGYLCTGGAHAVSGRDDVKRLDIRLDVDAVTAFIEKKAEALSGLPLLRVYWYDGALSGRLTTEQQLVGQKNNIKLRLGIVNGAGQQKEVDTKLVTDLAELARNKAICDAILVGGDGDLRLGVELAQQHGVRVHLLTITNTGVSPQLRMESDVWNEITVIDVKSFLHVVAPVAPTPGAFGSQMAVALSAALVPGVPTASALPAGALETVVSTYLAELDQLSITALTSAIGSANGNVPWEHDGKVLARARVEIGRDLSNPEKTSIRKIIRAQLGLI